MDAKKCVDGITDCPARDGETCTLSNYPTVCASKALHIAATELGKAIKCEAGAMVDWMKGLSGKGTQ